MEYKDYYEIMGVAETATPDDVKKAYKKLARRYHPDVSKEKNAEQRFKDVGEAYEVLKDPDKRREYDQLRALGALGGNGQFTPPPGWNPGARQHEHASGTADFSDFFETMFGRGAGGFGGQRGARMRRQGEDRHHELPLSLEEAWKGTEKFIEFSSPEIDEHGRQVRRSRKLKIKVPPGSIDGTVLRIKGQGESGIGADSAGDMLLTIRLASHPLYTVEGKDISLVVPVAPWEAALGSKLTVPTLKGRTIVSVPPNSQSGQKLRLGGLGMPASPPGDFYLVLKVVMPDTINDKAKELFAALQQEAAFNPRAAWETHS